ncbi:MAG: hypothetical protein ACJA1X_001326 [Bermanella sp.]|jgi:hypothetical protein
MPQIAYFLVKRVLSSDSLSAIKPPHLHLISIKTIKEVDNFTEPLT